MKALILAGGFGTRLKEVVKDVPKPMALIAGKPFLEHQLHLLKEQKITEVILAIHYMADKIKSYFGNGKRFEVDITYSEEETPLGTAGAIKRAEKYIDDTFFVLNGDSYCKMDLASFLEFHQSKRSNASVSLISSRDTSAYGKVILEGSKIAGFSEKKGGGEGLINVGVYLFEPRIFDCIEPEKNVSLEREVFPRLAREGKLYGYVCDGYFMDIGRPETYNQFKKDILENLIISTGNVREAMQRISRNGINLILVSDENKRLKGVLNERIIREYLLKGGNLDDIVENAIVRDPITARDTDDDSTISRLILEGINYLPVLDEDGKIADVRFRVEEIKEEVYPAVSGKAPLRISFGGGGTDVPHFFEKYGGVVISATIDKYCYATIVKRADSKIMINSDFNGETVLDSRKNLDYDGKFDIVKAIAKVMKPDFGFEIYTHNDVPPGRGLGSSASLAVLVAKLLSQLQGTSYDDYKIAEIAYKAEREQLGIKGGWQDQYAAVTGGFNFMEFTGEKSIVYPLRLKEDVINELNNRLLLCYVGSSHFSGDLHKSQEKSFLKNEEEVALKLNELKKAAIEIKDCLLTNNIERIGSLLHESWEIKRKLSLEISNPRIDELYDAGLRNGAYGGKLLGAGGGGYILFFYAPKKRNQLTKALREARGEVMDFNFELGGTRIWTS